MPALDVNLLRPYQVEHTRQLLRALIGYRAALDGSDTGTGKTIVALLVAKALDVVPLIICPRSLIPSWLYWSEKLGAPAEVINYEKVRMSGSKWGRLVPHGKGSYWEWAIRYSMIIFDEVQLCSGLKTINSKMLKAAKRQAQYVLGLSATAAENPGQLNALGYALGLHTGKDFWNWLRRYHYKPGIFGGMEWTNDPDKQAEAMARLNALIYPKRGARMRKKEIPGFPVTQIEPKLVGNPEEAAELLKELKESYQPGTFDHSIPQKLELLLVPYVVELAKLQAETSKVAIFCNYTATLDELQHQIWDAFGREFEPGIVDGRQVGDKGLAERARIVREFQENAAPVILLNSQAGGAGLSLHDPTGQVERSADIFPMYSARQLEQVLGRVHRDGGAFSQQFLLGFAGTLHEDIFLTVLQKRQNLITLNDGVFFGHFNQ